MSPRPPHLPHPLRRGLLRGGIALLTQPLLVGCAAAAAGNDPRRPGTPAPNAGRCVVRPSQTEGPFFVDERLARADIRSDPADGMLHDGVPLRLRFHVSRSKDGACTPAAGVIVDVWHCDALGRYSEVDEHGRLAPAGHGFLRGFQTTGDSGTAEFLTIFPGWYSGRTVHIHFKLRITPSRGRGEEFTSQLYFDDALTDALHRLPPYAARGPRTTRNADDGIFRRGGAQLMLNPMREDGGYAATFDVALEGEPEGRGQP